MSEENKFNFSEPPTPNNQNDSEQNSKEAIKSSAQTLFQSIHSFLNKLLDFREDTDREATISAIKTDISIKGATTWILICSIMVASVGLNANSTAVVIGAMLISPLMGPILGIGMSIAINDIYTLRKSLINFATMIVVSLLTAYLFFKFFPTANFETQELFGRKNPDLRDVLIAFFGGAALIIARTKKGTIASVIFGVAIATALMPPLCTAGYGLAHDIGYFTGAMYLFIINSIFIALATFLVLKILKFPMLMYANSKRRKRIARLASLVAIIVMAPAIWTFVQFYKNETYRQEFNRFKEKEIIANNELWLQNAIPNWDKKEITLYFNGEVSEATIADLQNELSTYKALQNFKLIIEGNQNQSIDRISVAYERAIIELDEKDSIIKELNNEIKSLKNSIIQFQNSDQKRFQDLAKDAKIRFTDLESFAYSNMLVSKDFIKTDTLTIITVKWKNNISDITINEKDKALSNWLKETLTKKSFILKRE